MPVLMWFSSAVKIGELRPLQWGIFASSIAARRPPAHRLAALVLCGLCRRDREEGREARAALEAPQEHRRQDRSRPARQVLPGQRPDPGRRGRRRALGFTPRARRCAPPCSTSAGCKAPYVGVFLADRDQGVEEDASVWSFTPALRAARRRAPSRSRYKAPYARRLPSPTGIRASSWSDWRAGRLRSWRRGGRLVSSYCFPLVNHAVVRREISRLLRHASPLEVSGAGTQDQAT